MPRGPWLWPGLGVLALRLAAAYALSHAASHADSDVQLMDPALRPHDFHVNDFDTKMKALAPDQPVLMEFYASWCPACKHFQPSYFRVSAFFHGEPRVQPRVEVARIDCATEGELCSQFSISHYPCLKLGVPAKFGKGNEKLLAEYAGDRTDSSVVAWVAKELDTKYEYDPTNIPALKATPALQGALVAAGPLGGAGEVTHRADLGDVTRATVLSMQYILDNASLLRGLERRGAFADWLALLARSHPAERCRRGARNMAAALPQLWHTTETDAADAAKLRRIAICGTQAAPKEWNSCKGSTADARGYTCGLWLLLHVLAARAKPETTGGAAWMTAVRGYVKHFFTCSDCSQHYVAMASMPAADEVATRRDAVLWAWRSHNEVNERLAKEEAERGDGDPAYPKAPWPPAALCPLCHAPALPGGTEPPAWHEAEVARFLDAFFWAADNAAQHTIKRPHRKGMPGGTAAMGVNAASGGEERTASGPSNAVKAGIVFLALAALALLARWRARPARKAAVL